MLCGLVGATYTRCPRPASQGARLRHAGVGGCSPERSPCCRRLKHREEAWKAFAAEGRFTPPDKRPASPPTPLGRTVNGAVAATVSVPAGESVEVPFLLAWHYPNKYNASATTWMGCHYATQWPDARAVMREAATGFATLRERTEPFRQTFYDSTLPYWLLDCITSQAAIIRHIGVVFRIANGDVYGWEGSNGCCQPTCTHVWGYEQSLSRLFPDLERDMRRIDFKHQQRADGGVNNRTDVPSPPHPTGEHPFADGHASCILKAYREALNQPDDAFLKEYWPHIKRAVEYLIAATRRPPAGSPRASCRTTSGTPTTRRCTASPRSSAAITWRRCARARSGRRRMGDAAAAERFHGIFRKGQKNLVELCWNGEYFQQHLPDYMKRAGRSRARLHGRPAHRPVVGAPAWPRLHPAEGEGACPPCAPSSSTTSSPT